jgi:hypothetical protein
MRQQPFFALAALACLLLAAGPAAAHYTSFTGPDAEPAVAWEEGTIHIQTMAQGENPVSLSGAVSGTWVTTGQQNWRLESPSWSAGGNLGQGYFLPGEGASWEGGFSNAGGQHVNRGILYDRVGGTYGGQVQALIASYGSHDTGDLYFSLLNGEQDQGVSSFLNPGEVDWSDETVPGWIQHLTGSFTHECSGWYNGPITIDWEQFSGWLDPSTDGTPLTPGIIQGTYTTDLGEGHFWLLTNADYFGGPEGGQGAFDGPLAGTMMTYGDDQAGIYHSAQPVPLPGAVWLLASGLGLLCARRRKR